MGSLKAAFLVLKSTFLGSQHNDWDINCHVAAQKAKNKQIEFVLDQILEEFKKFHSFVSDRTSGATNSVVSKSEAKSRKIDSDRKRKLTPRNKTLTPCKTPLWRASDLYSLVEGSALIPCLEILLRADSFLEICSHVTLNKYVIDIIAEMVSQPTLVPLLGPLPDQTNSLNSLLLSLGTQARLLLDRIERANVPKSGKAEEEASDGLARDFLNLSTKVSQALKQFGCLPSIDSKTSAESRGTATTIDCDDPKTESQASELYQDYMKSLKVESSTFSMSGSQAHAFISNFAKDEAPNSSLIRRIAQELSSLMTSLPLNSSSSIFLRNDDDKATLLRAVITGPEGTPYTGGCYQFDIYLPLKYPHCPPLVNFRTTGGGSVRFNPNLYNCGTVCLSLLGTWHGSMQSEKWNDASSLLQVLVSLQSLVLCAEPFYNEPGFDQSYGGTPEGKSLSLRYSQDVFKNNLKYAIIGQLMNPPEGFEQVIRAHFFLKRQSLINELEQMLEKFNTQEATRQFNEAKKLLMNLVQPPDL